MQTVHSFLPSSSVDWGETSKKEDADFPTTAHSHTNTVTLFIRKNTTHFSKRNER